DDVIRQHEPHVEHGHQRLAARQQLGVFEAAEQPDGLAHRFRIVITERRWLHLGRTEPGWDAASLHTPTTVHQSKKNQFPKYGTIRGDRSSLLRPPPYPRWATMKPAPFPYHATHTIA